MTSTERDYADPVTIDQVTKPDKGDVRPDSDRPSWLPFDLSPYIDGTVKRDEPTMGVARTDGLRLLYPGKEHTVIGETESGKSWFALACAAAELNAYDVPSPEPPEGLSESNDEWEVKPIYTVEGPDGSRWEVGPSLRWKHRPSANRHVVYLHFEESDPTATIHRLHDMGVRWIDISENFHFIAPDVPLTEVRINELMTDLAQRIRKTRIGPYMPPTLVIFDGVNEAMSLHGWDIRDETGVAMFRRRLIQRFKTHGAAILTCDHVVKDRDKRGRTPLGSIHKLNSLDGAAYLLENTEPMGQGGRGASRVFVTKDRPGAIRKHGVADRTTPGKTYVGMLIVDSVTADEFNPESYIDLSIVPPKPEETTTPVVDKYQVTDDRVFEVAEQCIRDSGKPVTTTNIRANAKMRYEDVADSLERLTTGPTPRLVRHGSGRAHLYSLP